MANLLDNIKKNARSLASVFQQPSLADKSRTKALTQYAKPAGPTQTQPFTGFKPTGQSVNSQPSNSGNLAATAPVYNPPARTQPQPSTARELFTNSLTQNNLTPLQQDSKSALQQPIQQPQQPAQAAPATPIISTPSDEAYKAAYQNYLTSLEPSKEVQAARQRYLDYISSANLGVSNLAGQGRGIPLDLVRGQQSKLQEQAGIEAQRLQGDIDIIQGGQLQSQTANKARADYEGALLDKQKPVIQEVGGNLVRYNPQTGQTETVYQGTEANKPVALPEGSRLVDPTTGKEIAPANKGTSPITLGEGQRLVNPTTGEVIIDAKTATDKDLNEYLTPKELTDLGLDSKYYGLTKGQAMQKLQSGEIAIPQDKLTTYQVDRANNTINQVNEALKNVSPFTTGVGAVLGVLPATTARTFAKQVEAIKANIGFNELQAMRAASPTGGALGQVAVQELNFLQSVLGSLDPYQAPSVVKANLESIKTHFTNWKNAVEEANKGQSQNQANDPWAGI